MNENENKKIKIRLQDYQWTCGDGCCHEYGWNLHIDDDKRINILFNDPEELIRQLLIQLGYKEDNIDLCLLDENGEEL